MPQIKEQELQAYRITRQGSDPKSGRGAFECGGRWNSKGFESIYGSPYYSTCILEILANANTTTLPCKYIFCKINIPSIPIEIVDAGHIKNWDSADQISSRKFGDKWLKEKRTAVLLVPSVVARPVDSNIVINPLHEDFKKIQWEAEQNVPFDQRLVK